MNIVEIGGNNEIIIITPTRDIKSKLAVDFINTIKSKSYYNPRIVLIESSGIEFHFSRNMNMGINEALKYNPKYIALSNDDVRPMEMYWDYKLINRIVEKQLAYVSPLFINSNGEINGPLINMPPYLGVLFSTTFYPLIPQFTFPFIRKINSLLSNKKYNIHDSSMFPGIINTQPFSIFHSDILKKVKGFSEDFLNGCEDFELALRINLLGFKCGLDTTVKFLNLNSATIGPGGFSIFQYKRSDMQQVNNWKTLIKKYRKSDYEKAILPKDNKIVFT
jgi:GT2 family glycosyltransferase